MKLWPKYEKPENFWIFHFIWFRRFFSTEINNQVYYCHAFLILDNPRNSSRRKIETILRFCHFWVTWPWPRKSHKLSNFLEFSDSFTPHRIFILSLFRTHFNFSKTQIVWRDTTNQIRWLYSPSHWSNHWSYQEWRWLRSFIVWWCPTRRSYSTSSQKSKIDVLLLPIPKFKRLENILPWR